MDGSNSNGERRKVPRIIMDLPIEFRIPNIRRAHGALSINLSKTGLLIQSVSNLPVGTKLSLVVFFHRGFELKDLKVSAEIVWKEICWKEGWKGFEYGLRFTEVEGEELLKLHQLLTS